MTLTIKLTSEQEARLRAEAKREGKEPAAVMAALLDTLPAQATLPNEAPDLFADWNPDSPKQKAAEAALDQLLAAAAASDATPQQRAAA